MKSTYAFSATVLFSVFIVMTAVYGGETSAHLVAISAFIGALSQFIAQDERNGVKLVSVIVAYVAMGFGLAALVFWA